MFKLRDFTILSKNIFYFKFEQQLSKKSTNAVKCKSERRFCNKMENRRDKFQFEILFRAYGRCVL